MKSDSPGHSWVFKTRISRSRPHGARAILSHHHRAFLLQGFRSCPSPIASITRSDPSGKRRRMEPSCSIRGLAATGGVAAGRRSRQVSALPGGSRAAADARADGVALEGKLATSSCGSSRSRGPRRRLLLLNRSGKSRVTAAAVLKFIVEIILLSRLKIRWLQRSCR